jgi:hypothetical protein
VNKTKKRPLFSVLKIKCCSSYTEYRNEIGCFTNFNTYHSWWYSPFLRKKVMMIRKLSISMNTYPLKRRVSFLLITTGYTSHVFFFLVLFTTLRSFKDIMTIRYAFLMIFATDIPHFKCTFHKQLIHLHTFDYFLRSEMFLKNWRLRGPGCE